jgi:hypothetical protein
MLQTVPDTPCADIDIFDGFGNAGMGVPASMGDGDFSSKMSSGVGPFDKRIENLSSASGGDSSSDNTSFTSPPIMNTTSSMEYPGLAEYGGYPDLSGSSMGNGGSGNNHMAVGAPRAPLGQSSATSFGMQIPRSVPEFVHLQRASSDSVDMGMVAGDLPFR